MLIHEIWETEEDKYLSAGDLKQKYFILAKNRFVCNPAAVVLNKEKNNHTRWVKCAALTGIRGLDECGYRLPPVYNIAKN